MTAGLDSIVKDRRFFNRLFFTIQFSIGFYAVSFFLLEARLSALLYTLNVLVLGPLVLFLERKRSSNGARFGLLIQGLFAIYATPLGVRAPLHAELYYIAAFILPMVVFDVRRRKLTLLAQLLCALTWVLHTWGPMPALSSYWIPESFPYQPFQILNAVGTSAILGIVVRLYTDSIYHFQRRLNSANRSLGEAQRIAKLGGWEYRTAAKEMIWSEQLYEIFGRSRNDAPKDLEQFTALIDPQDRGAWTSAFTACLNEGQAFTLRVRTMKANAELWIEARAQGLYDDENRLSGLIGTIQDVSSVVNTEKHLRHRQSLLEAILHSTPAIIFVKEYKKGLTFSLLNHAGEEFLGVKEADVLGMTLHEILPTEQAESCAAREREAISSRKILVNEIEDFVHPAGTKKLRTYRVPTFDENGNPDLLIGIFQDITEEVEAKTGLELERLKTIRVAKLASLGEMSAGMAHEINNPLTTIELITGQLPRVANDPEKVQEKVEVIERSVRRISKIVNGLRRYSRSGPKPEFQLHSLNAILAEAATLTEVKARAESVTVTIDGSARGHIRCDEIEIEQVMINLINNAIDAVKSQPDKWVRLVLREEPEAVVVQVIDAGPGVPENLRAKLFEPFFTTKRSGEGTGLGLSITKNILEDHQATIDILRGHPNTCFEIRFPRPPAALADAA